MHDKSIASSYPCQFCGSKVLWMWDTPNGGLIQKCECGWLFFKSTTKHPWDTRHGHVYIGRKQYKDKYV